MLQISMKMLQRQGFYDILNCEGHNATLASLLKTLPSHRWISLAFMPKKKKKWVFVSLLEKLCRDTRGKEQMQTGKW